MAQPMKISICIFTITLIIIFCLLIFAGCQSGQIDAPQYDYLPEYTRKELQPEELQESYPESAIIDAVAAEPEQPIESEQPAETPDEVYEAAPIQVFEPRPVYVPPEVPPATLAEAFLAVVYRLSFLDGDESDPFPSYSFSLMDIDFDGYPELIVSMFSSPNGFPTFVIFDKGAAIEFIAIADDFEASTFIWTNLINGIYPARFYQHGDTGDIIFSSHSVGWGGGIGYSVFYINKRTFQTHRVVRCSRIYWDNSHSHSLSDSSMSFIKEIHVDPKDREDDYDQCGVWLEGDSHEPTIAALVNMALEGFTEIPAPHRYDFDGDYEWFFKDYTQDIQDWIFRVLG